MKTEKPLKLIALLTQLLNETDKMNVGKAYIAVVEEMRSVSFVTAQNTPFSDLIYKHLIQLSIKDFIHAGRSEASAIVVRDVIEVISNADIIV
ncbi:hypothetical protein [Flavobacterium sp.]|uniref:hypothetical protein n=1 Tax=Flavobacterium sp. TaxID=239 RepID=UPI00286CB207|nr:hypothetical protein [Flavobacterium sp.]